MEITKIITGPLEENCYLLEKNKECLLIDPGEDYDKIVKYIQNKKVLAILVTHHHFDHTASIPNLVKNFHYPVYDSNNLKRGDNQLGSFHFEVIETFGHTLDSLTFYFPKEQKMFTGDFLFYDTIGRTDFEDSNEEEMRKSIEKIKNYPNEIEIYPGHARMTTLGREKEFNIFF